MWWLWVEDREKRERHGVVVVVIDLGLWVRWLWIEEREKRKRHSAMVVVIDLGLWVW